MKILAMLHVHTMTDAYMYTCMYTVHVNVQCMYKRGTCIYNVSVLPMLVATITRPALSVT